MLSIRNPLVGLSVLFFFISSNAFAKITSSLSNPAEAPQFLMLEDGTNLKKVKVSGQSLRLSYGSGRSFGKSQWQKFNQLKADSQSDPAHLVQWALMDLTNHQMLESSADSQRKLFGASVSKTFVGATLLARQNGQLSQSELQKMANMLVVSSNAAWSQIQILIGGGNDDLGKERIHQFTQQMGYFKTRGYKGYWGDLHGNELTAQELVEFMYDTFQDQYEGASTLWKIIHTCRTGGQRGRKYLPSNLPVGAKTGTYDGRTVDPETGRNTFPDGRPYTVQARHHLLTFWIDGRQYALAILANNGSDEPASLLAGGFYRMLAGVSP